MTSYIGEPLICLNDCPLKFWKTKRHKYPKLAQLARRFLSAPACSVASEQSFSTASDVFDEKRSRLSVEKAEQLIFMNRVLPSINYSY
jgi:hypothetical protein